MSPTQQFCLSILKAFALQLYLLLGAGDFCSGAGPSCWFLLPSKAAKHDPPVSSCPCCSCHLWNVFQNLFCADATGGILLVPLPGKDPAGLHTVPAAQRGSSSHNAQAECEHKGLMLNAKGLQGSSAAPGQVWHCHFRVSLDSQSK